MTTHNEQGGEGLPPAEDVFAREDSKFKQFLAEYKWPLSVIGIIAAIILIALLIPHCGSKQQGADNQTANSEYAASATASTDGHQPITIVNQIEWPLNVIKQAVREVFSEFEGKFGGGDDNRPHKIYFTNDQAELVTQYVLNHMPKGGDPEQLQRLRGINRDLAEQLDRKIKELDALKGKQPAPTLQAPATDPTTAKALAKLQAGQDEMRRAQEEMAKNQQISAEELARVLQDARKTPEGQQAEEKAKGCKPGESVPLIKADQPFSWYIIMSRAEKEELGAATGAARNEVEKKYNGQSDVPLSSVFVPFCIPLDEHYVLVDQSSDGQSVISQKDGGGFTLNHGVTLMWLFVKPNPLIEVLDESNIDASIGADYPVLKAGQ